MHAIPKSAAARATSRAQGEQECGDSCRERDLRPVPALEPLDRDPGSVGKQQQHAQRQEDETSAVAQEGA